MSNYALVFAGGVGRRMNSRAVPKQFLEIHAKPVIIHTLEHFEESTHIDAICVVCVKDWMDHLHRQLQRFNIKKVRWMVEGGDTALESQYRGLQTLQADAQSSESDIVLIHDGVRPMIDERLIDACIESVHTYGSAITVVPENETVVQVRDEAIVGTIQRSSCMIARAPQCFYLKDILQVHEAARREGKADYVDSASLMLDHGHKLHVVQGPVENIKVTTPTDFYICRALLDARENNQIYGL